MRIREPVNALTHLIGALFFFILTLILFTYVLSTGAGTDRVVSVLVFGMGLIALYLTSGLYHTVNTSPERLKIWRKLDHTMIFVLIAATYTPFCLLALPSSMGNTLLILVWSIALIGSLMMIFWIGMPRWLNTVLYILMGWVGVFCVVPLFYSLSPSEFFLLILGGVFYTIGGVIYGIKKPNLSKSVGFHELFHIFCLLGSFCQFLAVVLLVIA